ncbi:type IIL restriction-modification enzyme MmeI [Cribrihabitans marinus]|uniref:type IIL restriction-modification enzyme MmeI n=1 Tax=Cribrihabitans marinus TaxID=1227549 RepID=UPI000B81912E|nr:type IIL restriction-modification enzyme MmeI [Cribrihabitans marinus]GGH36633.1 hypothetical protein GCM10010973_30690 [Cribrihabitans marinus]
MSSPIEQFIDRWRGSGGSERANFQRFAIELTQLLGVEEPKIATSDDQDDDYRFERPVDFGPTSTRSHGFIDLYRRGCFVLEAKQGAERRSRHDPNQLSMFVEDAPKQARTGHCVRGTSRWDDTMLKQRLWMTAATPPN